MKALRRPHIERSESGLGSQQVHRKCQKYKKTPQWDVYRGTGQLTFTTEPANNTSRHPSILQPSIQNSVEPTQHSRGKRHAVRSC